MSEDMVRSASASRCLPPTDGTGGGAEDPQYDPEPGRWVQNDLRAHEKLKKGKFSAPDLTDFHHRCCAILSRAFRTGIYNLPVTWEKAEFRGGNYPFVSLVVACHRGLATWDFDHLTRLVIAAHDECIRIDVEPASRGYFRIHMHPRQREGGMSTRHPTIEQAVADYRGVAPQARFPARCSLSAEGAHEGCEATEKPTEPNTSNQHPNVSLKSGADGEEQSS